MKTPFLRTWLSASVVSMTLLGGSIAAQVPLEAGNVVASYCPNLIGPGGSPDPAGPSVMLVSVNSVGPLGTNWLAPLFWNEGAGADEWSYQNLGSIFGLALDGQSNVYAAASSNYGNYGTNTYGPGGGGAVYRLDGHNGAIQAWMTTGSGAVGTSTLLNPAPAGVTPPGLGDICYDALFDQFFVSNFADGRIYRIKDNGTQGVVQAVYDPFLPYPYAGSPTFAPLGERVWAVHVAVLPVPVSRTLVAKRVLLFSVWLRDHVRKTTPWPGAWPFWFLNQTNNAIFYWEFDALGGLVSAGPRLYGVMPHLKDGVSWGYSNPVSDITGTRQGLFFAERGMTGDYGQVGFGHEARLLKLVPAWQTVVLGTTGTQILDPFDYRYRVGDYDSPRGWNCAGGVAAAIPYQFAGGVPSVWSTGDALRGYSSGNYIYGLQRMFGKGNFSCTPYSSCTNLIDLDHNITSPDKAQPGDVEYIKVSAP